MGELNILHEIVVVNSLVTLVILGVENGFTFDFSQTPVAVYSGLARHSSSSNGNIAVAQVLPIYEAAQANLNCIHVYYQLMVKYKMMLSMNVLF